MRPRRSFLFEMIPRWNGVWQRMRFVTPAVAVTLYVKFDTNASISTPQPNLMVDVSYTTSGEERQTTAVVARMQTTFEIFP